MSPAEFAQAFAGTSTSTLRWMGGQAATAGTPVPDDEITITLTYQGADGLDCNFAVPVAIEIMTRDSAIHEMGNAWLTAQDGSFELADFSFGGKQVVVSGTLNRSSGSVAMSGTLQSVGTDLPGSSAQFPAPISIAGSGGSGGAP